MSFVNSLRRRSMIFPLFGLLMVVSSVCAAQAGETYSLEIEELEKKSYEIGGFAEVDWEHMAIQEDGAASFLNFRDESRSTLDRVTGTLQLGGSYTKGIGQFKWLAEGSAAQDDLGWSDDFAFYEGYVSISPSSEFNASMGKKSYKWGKGYAWNPVGFINRTKDPNNPEEALEGYVTTEAEWIKSFSGDLQNVAFTSVLLPVWQDVNENFGSEGNVNLAAKLYLLYLDTDLDFMAYTGNSRTSRFGVDFSRNITSNFEVHGEIAYFNNLERLTLDENNWKYRETSDATSFLAGIRYLSAHDLTTIIEYYHNGNGYSEEELSRFFDLVDEAQQQWLASGEDALFNEVEKLSSQGFSKPYPGKNYLYAKLSQKEPFDILYFSPALTAIVNLDDQSYSVTPEITYTGFTNWELLLRFALLQGDASSEYGEKQNSNKVELRVRYFF